MGSSRPRPSRDNLRQRMLRVALVVCALALACVRPSVAPPSGSKASPPQRGRAIAIVTGAPWIGGGPPDHRPWRAIAALDQRHDIVPIELEGPIERGVGVIVVPQLSSLTQAQLDRLAQAIDGGMPAILVADPLPISDLRVTPGEPSVDDAGSRLFDGAARPPMGDAVGFLARLGVAWRPGDVVVDAESVADAPLELVLGDAAPPLVGPLLLPFAGELAPARDGIAWTSLVTTRRPTQTASTDGYIVRNPLFGPQLTDPRPPEPAPRDGSDARARTIVARVDAPAGTTRAPVIVAADLDVFGTPLTDFEVDAESFANRSLLAGLVGQLVGDGTDPVSPADGAPLLDPTARDEVVAIDLASQTDRTLPPELGGRVVRSHQWLRLTRRGSEWALQSSLVEPADAARVGALLDALAQAQWQAAPTTAAVLRDPSTEGLSDAMRIVARRADGTTALDVLVAGSGDPRVARSTFASETRAVRLALASPSARSFARGIDLGVARSQVVSSSVTTYRFDTARSMLTDVATNPTNAAGLDALLGARLFPVRRLVEPNLVELALHGFNVAPGGRVWGTVGEIELKLAGDETVRVVFGAAIEHERAAIVEGRDDDAVWIYAVDEAIVRRVLGPS